MTEITVFDFEDNAVRVVDKDGEPWFVAADVARVLEYRDAANATRYLDEDEKGTLNQSTPLIIISESGLYQLIFNSRKPEAKKFRKWVTAEVLPSIRKTGVYVSPEAAAANEDDDRNLSDLPDRTFTQWINLVRETRLLYGRSAARDVWEKSPLPTPGRIGACAARPLDGEFSPTDGEMCLKIIMSAVYEKGAIKRGTGVRPVSMFGKDYVFIANAHPYLQDLLKNTLFKAGKHTQALLMVDGAVRSPQSVRIGSLVCRGVLIPQSQAMKKAA